MAPTREMVLQPGKQQAGDGASLVLHVAGTVAPQGEAVGLTFERSGQAPVEVCLRSEDVTHLVGLLLNLGGEARRRAPRGDDDGPPGEAIPLPLDAIDLGHSLDGQNFMLLEVGLASLLFTLSPQHLEQLGQTMLLMSREPSARPS